MEPARLSLAGSTIAHDAVAGEDPALAETRGDHLTGI